MPNIEAFLRELKLDKINAKISEAWKTPKSRRSRNTNLRYSYVFFSSSKL